MRDPRQARQLLVRRLNRHSAHLRHIVRLSIVRKRHGWFVRAGEPKQTEAAFRGAVVMLRCRADLRFGNRLRRRQGRLGSRAVAGAFLR